MDVTPGHRTWNVNLVALLLASGCYVTGARAAPQQDPAFSCAKVAQGSIEALVCANAELSALDRKLAGV